MNWTLLSRHWSFIPTMKPCHVWSYIYIHVPVNVCKSFHLIQPTNQPTLTNRNLWLGGQREYEGGIILHDIYVAWHVWRICPINDLYVHWIVHTVSSSIKHIIVGVYECVGVNIVPYPSNTNCFQPYVCKLLFAQSKYICIRCVPRVP